MQHVRQRLVSTDRDVGLDPLGLDLPAVLQHNRRLQGKERTFGITSHPARLPARKAADDGRRAFNRHFLVKVALWINLHERTFTTKSEASNAADLHPAFKPL